MGLVLFAVCLGWGSVIWTLIAHIPTPRGGGVVGARGLKRRFGLAWGLILGGCAFRLAGLSGARTLFAAVRVRYVFCAFFVRFSRVLDRFARCSHTRGCALVRACAYWCARRAARRAARRGARRGARRAARRSPPRTQLAEVACEQADDGGALGGLARRRHAELCCEPDGLGE